MKWVIIPNWEGFDEKNLIQSFNILKKKYSDSNLSSPFQK